MQPAWPKANAPPTRKSYRRYPLAQCPAIFAKSRQWRHRCHFSERRNCFAASAGDEVLLQQAGACKRVQVTVGGTVIHLANGAPNGSDRRAKDEEIERKIFQQRSEYGRSSQLGCQDAIRGFTSFDLRQASTRDACGVNHSVNCAEPAASFVDGILHLHLVADVGGENEALRAQLLEGAKLSDLS